MNALFSCMCIFRCFQSVLLAVASRIVIWICFALCSPPVVLHWRCPLVPKSCRSYWSISTQMSLPLSEVLFCTKYILALKVLTYVRSHSYEPHASVSAAESLSVEFVCNVLVVADQLLIPRLKEICEVAITENCESLNRLHTMCLQSKHLLHILWCLCVCSDTEECCRASGVFCGIQCWAAKTVVPAVYWYQHGWPAWVQVSNKFILPFTFIEWCIEYWKTRKCVSMSGSWNELLSEPWHASCYFGWSPYNLKLIFAPGPWRFWVMMCYWSCLKHIEKWWVYIYMDSLVLYENMDSSVL